MYYIIQAHIHDGKSPEPAFKTELKGFSYGIGNAHTFFAENGFSEDPESTPGYVDYVKELENPEDIFNYVSAEDNPRLMEFLLEGDIDEDSCRIVLHAYEMDY